VSLPNGISFCPTALAGYTSQGWEISRHVLASRPSRRAFYGLSLATHCIGLGLGLEKNVLQLLVVDRCRNHLANLLSSSSSSKIRNLALEFRRYLS